MDEEELSSSRLFPLHFAIRKHNANKVSLLLDEGISPNQSYGFLSALGLAIMENQTDIVKVLLAAGCKPNIGDLRGIPPIMMATKVHNTEVVDLLIRAGCDLNLKYSNGNTAFLQACEDNQIDLATTLACNSCDINGRNKAGQNALHIASYNGNIDIMKFLFKKGFDPNVIQGKTSGVYGTRALHLAASENRSKAVQLLVSHDADIETRDNNNRTPLQQAVSKGSIDAARVLIENNCDVDVMCMSGPVLHMAVSQGCQEMIQLLIDAGSDVNAQNPETKVTPLSIACDNGDVDSLSLLIQAGANPNLSDLNGESILITTLRAAAGHCSQLELSAMLLLSGATVSVQEYNLIYALSGTHSCESLSSKCKSLIKWLQCHIENTSRLQVLCRGCIRNSLGSNMSVKVHKLPIPNRMKKFIQCSEIKVPDI